MGKLRGVHAGMPVVVCALALGGCASAGPKPYAEIPIAVHIAADCSIDQGSVELDYGRPTYPGPYHFEVLWIVDKAADETAVLSSKPAADQDPDNDLRGWEIKALLADYLLRPGKTEVHSGKPKHRPPYKKNGEGKEYQGVEWRYGITIFKADGSRKCYVDPGICYRTPDGGWVCPPR